MAAYAHEHDSGFMSRRATAFVIICGLHVLIIYGLATGLAHKVVELVAPPIQTDIVQEVQKRDEPPPPPPPKMERPPVEVPPPDVAINVPVESTSTAIREVAPTRNEAPAPPPPPVSRTRAMLDQKHSPSTEDYYPPTSRRMGEQGITNVNVCVGGDGKINGMPKVEKSSGSTRLDEAAVKWASHARFTPATENGKAVEACTAFAVKFVLTD
jgi:protein TonB